MKLKNNVLTCIFIVCSTFGFCQISDNSEILELSKSDQADRQTEHVDWKIILPRDSIRRVRIIELLNANKVQTSNDYANAALIFQHGRDSIAHGMAVKMMRKALELDSTRSKWLLAAAIDRELMSKHKPQIYGTQYQKPYDSELWHQYLIDTTVISDKERIFYGVETLAQQKEKLKLMNKKTVGSLFLKGESIENIISICKSENSKKEPEFNLSENRLNEFGYDLMTQGKLIEALSIFKMITEFYPTSSNAFDSYGECLLKVNKINEGVAAYKKSLELDPRNSNAVMVLKQYEGK